MLLYVNVLTSQRIRIANLIFIFL